MDKKIHDIHILKNGEEMKVYREIEGNIYFFEDRIEILNNNFYIFSPTKIYGCPTRTIIMLPFDLKGIKIVID